MVTSKSDKNKQQWKSGALVYSGRPDPSWEVATEVAKSILTVWEGLDAWSGSIPMPPALGYRGCYLENDRGERWNIYHDYVEHTSRGSTVIRRDNDRVCEKLILGTAPKGVLPPMTGKR